MVFMELALFPRSCLESADRIHRGRTTGIPRLEVIRVPMDMMVERISLDRVPTRFRDQMSNLVDCQDLWGCCAGIMVDQFVPDRAIDIVGSVS